MWGPEGCYCTNAAGTVQGGKARAAAPVTWQTHRLDAVSRQVSVEEQLHGRQQDSNLQPAQASGIKHQSLESAEVFQVAQLLWYCQTTAAEVQKI